jgi:lysophospholipase L1-like esterase
MRAARTLLLRLALVVLLAGCSSGTSPGSAGSKPSSGSTTYGPRTSAAASPAPAAPYAKYVAMGDSYSAGPLIPTTDLAGGCARSDHNYPSLLARRLHVRTFVDVSCSGASTHDLTHAQHPFQGSTIPPQLKALTPDTDLVTIGIGGNDLDLFSTLVGTCTGLRAQDPTGSPCTDSLKATGPDLDTMTVTIASRVADALRAIQRKAPKAAVVLVGYLRLVPDHGTCPGLPLATGDYPEGRRIASTVDQALSRAAAETSTTYVDAYALSKNHDICSAHPWVNGRRTRQGVALAYHPLESGMRAVAGMVQHELDTFG